MLQSTPVEGGVWGCGRWRIEFPFGMGRVPIWAWGLALLFLQSAKRQVQVKAGNRIQPAAAAASP